MPTLEEMNVDLDDVSFKPITEIALIMRGAHITIGTSLSVEIGRASCRERV